MNNLILTVDFFAAGFLDPIDDFFGSTCVLFVNKKSTLGPSPGFNWSASLTFSETLPDSDTST